MIAYVSNGWFIENVLIYSVKKSSSPYRLFVASSNIGTNPLGGLTTLTAVDDNNQRQSITLPGLATQNLGLTFSLTTLAFSLFASVISIMLMSAGAAIFPVSYKNASIRVRTG